MKPSPARWGSSVLMAAAAVTSANLLIALVGIPTWLCRTPTPAERIAVFIGLGLGPLSGWVTALQEGEVVKALPMLAVMTAATIVPLAFALARRSTGALTLGAVAWLVSGYLFTIAIWI